MKKLLSLVLFPAVFFWGCTEDLPVETLYESGIAFNEKLATISADCLDKSLFYIATEDGIVYVYHSDNNAMDTIYTPFDRIYRVVRDTSENNLYWLGVRNEGLRKCRFIGNELYDCKADGYSIGSKKKSRYSCYDIYIHNADVYLATSQGLFVLNKEQDKLKAIYPSYSSSVQDIVVPHPITKLQAYKDTLMFVSDGKFLEIDLKGNPYAVGCKLMTPERKPPFYHANSTDYMIDEHHIIITPDSLQFGKNSRKLSLRRRVRTNCHHLITDDSAHSQSLLVTENALLRIPYHITSDSRRIDFSCVDNEDIYYLVDGTKIFKQDSSMRARQIYEIHGGRQAKWMDVSHGVLYYSDLSGNRIFKVRLTDSYWRNLFAREIQVQDSIEQKITAFCVCGTKLFVGVQDGILCLPEDSQNLTLLDSSYITRYYNDGDSLLYAATLNDGLYLYAHETFRPISGTDSYPFIRDLALKGDSTFFLTNHSLYVKSDSTTAEYRGRDIASGFSRLLTSGAGLLGLKEFGITSFCDSMDYLQDVQFVPNACQSLNGTVYLSSSSDVFFFKTLSQLKSGDFHRVDFIPVHFSRQNLLLLALLAIILIIGLWWNDRYKLSAHSLRMLKRGLNNRIEKLKLCYQWLHEGTIEEIEAMDKDVMEIDEKGGKKSVALLRKLSENIMLVTSRVSFELRPALKAQIKELRSEEDPLIAEAVDQSEKINESTDFLKLVAQLESNSVLLTKTHNIHQRLAELRLLTSSEPWSLKLDSIASLLQEENPSLIASFEQIRSTLTSSATKQDLELIIKEQIIDLESIEIIGFKDELKLVIEEIFRHIRGEYQVCLDLIPRAVNSEETIAVMRMTSITNQRLFLIKQLCSINKNIHLRFERLNSLKASKPCDLDKIMDEEVKIEESLPNLYRTLRKSCVDFCRCIAESPDKELFDELSIDLEDQRGRQLPLVICEATRFIKKSNFGEIFLGDTTSLSRARGKLKDVLNDGKEIIETYSKQVPSSIASYLLSCKVQ